jgi:hypothetical protein
MTAMRHIIIIPVNAIDISTANMDHSFIRTSLFGITEVNSISQAKLFHSYEYQGIFAARGADALQVFLHLRVI